MTYEFKINACDMRTLKIAVQNLAVQFDILPETAAKGINDYPMDVIITRAKELLEAAGMEMLLSEKSAEVIPLKAPKETQKKKTVATIAKNDAYDDDRYKALKSATLRTIENIFILGTDAEKDQVEQILQLHGDGALGFSEIPPEKFELIARELGQ